MNKVILMGRLTRDPEVKYTQTQKGESLAIARYTLAVDRGNRNQEQTADFISCVAMGKLGENAEKYFKQGTKLVVEGHWQTGSYTNKEGTKVYTNDCFIEKQEFCESKNTNANVGGSTGGSTNNEDTSDGFMNIPDGIEDELPFK